MGVFHVFKILQMELNHAMHLIWLYRDVARTQFRKKEGTEKEAFVDKVGK